jgi:hypothetical protein
MNTTTESPVMSTTPTSVAGGRGLVARDDRPVLDQLRALVGHLEAHPDLAGIVFNVQPVCRTADRLCVVSVYAHQSREATLQAWLDSFDDSAVVSVHRGGQHVWVTVCSGVLAVQFHLDDEQSWAAARTFRLTGDQPREVTPAELLACLATAGTDTGRGAA